MGRSLRVGEGEADPAVEHCSPRAIGWKRSADVICFQWLFQKNNCGDTARSIIWIFVFERCVCVALREARKYNAAEPNTIKMDCVCLCVYVCVCVRVFAGLITITRPRTSLDGLLNVSYGLAIGWYFLSASVCLSLLLLSDWEKKNRVAFNKLT